MKKKKRIKIYHMKLKDCLISGVIGLCVISSLVLGSRVAVGALDNADGEEETAVPVILMKESLLDDARASLSPRTTWPDLKQKDESLKERLTFRLLRSELPLMGAVGEELYELQQMDKGNGGDQGVTFPPSVEPEPDVPPKDPAVMPEGAFPIETVSIVPKSTSGYLVNGNVYLSNKTKYEVDLGSLLYEKLTFHYQPGEPQVLIVHTHATESYSAAGRDWYTEEENNRSFLEEENMIGIGALMAQELEKRGVGVIHNKTVHDYPSFTGSYDNALKTIEAELAAHPTIKIVLDVHRDAIGGGGSPKSRPIVQQDGKDYAQVMLVMGTDEGGLTHDNWAENLKFAVRVQRNMENQVQNIARPIMLKPQRYNQHATPGSLLFEMGASGNYRDDVVNSLPIVAEAVAKALKEG